MYSRYGLEALQYHFSSVFKSIYIEMTSYPAEEFFNYNNISKSSFSSVDVKNIEFATFLQT